MSGRLNVNTQVKVDPEKPVGKGHVVMAVPGSLARDIRVQKTAMSVQSLGYKVTVIYADPGANHNVEGSLNGVRTLGLPVRFDLVAESERKANRRKERRKHGLRIGYPDGVARDLADRRLAVEALRAPTTRRYWVGLRLAIHAVRSSALDRRQRNEEGKRGYRALRNWRHELPNIACAEAVFGPQMRQLDPDILHVHDYHLIWGAANAKLYFSKRGKNVPLIYDAHEYVAGQHMANEHVQAAAANLEREASEHIDDVITVSEPIADRLQTDLALTRRPTVVLNGPPLSWGQVESSRQLRSELRLSQDVPLVVYSGGLGPARNLSRAIEAMEDVKDAHLAIVCVPNAHYRVAQKLDREIEALGLSDRVHLVEPVQPDQIISSLSSADLGIHPMIGGLPNHEMALPNKLFDYLRAGLPVVTSDLQELGQFVRTWGIGEVFDPDDPASIAAAIKRALANREALAAATQNQELLHSYSWECQEENLAALYQSLQSRSAAS